MRFFPSSVSESDRPFALRVPLAKAKARCSIASVQLGEKIRTPNVSSQCFP